MLFQIVQKGWRDPFNKTQRLTMPAFAGQLSRNEIIAVVDYLKNPVDVDTARVSAGGKPAPAVPAGRAMTSPTSND